jgi:hypothetical protein
MKKGTHSSAPVQVISSSAQNGAQQPYSSVTQPSCVPPRRS